MLSHCVHVFVTVAAAAAAADVDVYQVLLRAIVDKKSKFLSSVRERFVSFLLRL